MIFDGNVDIFGTCRDCGEQMRVTEYGETVHPTCNPKPTLIESLSQGWLSTVLAGDREAERLTLTEIGKVQESQDDSLHARAMAYAEWGWPVFPLRGQNTRCDGGTTCKLVCQCPKKPVTKHGFQDATNEVARIDKWWSRHPDHNIGLATGHSFDVFDIDTAKGGLAPFLTLLHQERIPQTHGVVVTASGGMHFYLKPIGKPNAAGFKVQGKRVYGLDYRGIGGYVVAPPSILNGNKGWSWMSESSPTIKAAS